MDTFWQFGGNVSNLIFWLSSFLTKPEMPGWIVLLIVLALAVLMMMAWHSAQTKLNAIQWLESAVEKTKDEVNFAAEVPRIGAEATKRRNEKGYRHITAAWDEFRETFIVDETVQPPVLRNSIRPSAFFNVEDLHCGPGFYRLLPGLFVTIGLFLTFLGLISALQAISIDADASAQDMRKALNALLGAASAKFIMSLTGLLSSILFTIFLRICFTDRIEAKIHRLCVLLEERLSFISLEDLAMRQLEIARGQEEVFKRIGLELVEKLGEPLRKEVPDRIASSIQTAMGPLLDQVGKAGASGVDQMVGDLSKRLSEDVGRALSEASTQLSAAAEKIAILSERMDQSSGQMGREMENSITKLARAAEDLSARLASAAETTDGTLNAGAEKLLGIMNQTLDGIRQNTSEGADALREAAADMRTSAGTFREQLDAAAKSGAAAAQASMDTAGKEIGGAIASAGKGLVEVVNMSGADLIASCTAFGDKLREDLVEPLIEVVNQLDEMAVRLKDGSGQIATAASNIRIGGEAARGASDAINVACRDLQTAASPIQGSVERIETAVTGLSQSTERVSETVTRSARETAESAARILEAAKAALGGEQELLEATLSKLGELLQRIENQRDQVDEMDEKLGSAFEQFTQHVRTAVDTLHRHVRDMNGELAPAIDKMHEIVDRAEQFIPASRR